MSSFLAVSADPLSDTDPSNAPTSTAQSGENPSTMTNFDYATTNDVFTAGVEQMAKGKVYVNFQKGDVWSDIQLRLTLVQETNNAAANVQQAVSYTTEVGALALNDNGASSI